MTGHYTALDLQDRVNQDPELPAPIHLTDEQIAVVQCPLGSTLVVAGAGSGKTLVMALRLVYLVANRLVKPEQVLGLTFTRKAAAQMNRRIRGIMGWVRGGIDGDGLDGWPVVSTYNSYAASLVRSYGLAAGLDPMARVLTAAQQWELANQVVEAWDGDPELARSAATLTGVLTKLADKLADNGLTGSDVAGRIEAMVVDLMDKPPGPSPETGRLIRSLPSTIKSSALGHLSDLAAMARLAGQYQERKAALGVMDFADQVAWARQIVAESETVATNERTAWQAVLLDEFQDTSPLQIKLLSALFAATPVMAVGDPNQAIYGFRGASAQSMAEFIDAFPGPPGASQAPRVLTLSQARRNAEAILSAANRVAEPLRGDLSRVLTEKLSRRLAGDKIDLPVLRPAEGAPDGSLEVAFFETAADEAEHVAAYLEREWRSGAESGAGRTAAVLLRNRSQAGPIRSALEAAGLPYRLALGSGLLDEPEVRDVISALTAASDLDRGDAFVRLAASPRFALGIKDLNALQAVTRRNPGWSVLDVVEELIQTGAWSGPSTAADLAADTTCGLADDLAAEATSHPTGGPAGGKGQDDLKGIERLSRLGRRRLVAMGQILRTIRRAAAQLSLPDLVLEAERRLGLDVDLLARYGPQGRAQIGRLVSEAYAYSQAETSPDLEGFLNWLEIEGKSNGLPASPVRATEVAVDIMTIHGAKGLEWDVVVVPGLSDGQLPGVALNKDGERLSSGWLTGGRGGTQGDLPWDMCLDSEARPQFLPSQAQHLGELKVVFEEFRRAAADFLTSEDRRLAYVALTRPKTHLLVTGSMLSPGGSKPHPPSVFLEELVSGADGLPGLAEPAIWVTQAASSADTAPQPPPADTALQPPPAGSNQVDQDPPDGWLEDYVPLASRAVWPPVHPLGDREDAVRSAAEQIESQRCGPATPSKVVDRLLAVGTDLAQDAVLLIKQAQKEKEQPGISLPDLVSATSLIRLADDRTSQVRRLRRPLPAKPSPGATVGEEFHARVALELAHRARHGGQQSLFEDVTLVAYTADRQVASAVERLMTSFRESRWFTGAYEIEAVEAGVEAQYMGHVISARIDAVFRDRDGHLVVVDWKTGRSNGGLVHPAYEGQVLFYQAVLALARGVQPSSIKAYVHYVSENLSLEVKYRGDYLADLMDRIQAG
ncbi:MAG: ATP-dependent helicase [Bifidobacteriaceae bacterium]|nr:ATP-dependent helicase [Bifidobacteriaceae bacterium]